MAKTTSTYISNKQNLKYCILATIIAMLHTRDMHTPISACPQKLIINTLSYVCAFLRVAGSEFQRDGAMKLKECCPNDLSFCFGILSCFSLEDVKHQLTYLLIRRPDESETVEKCREMEKDKEVKTLQNGGKQSELQSCTGSRILRVASEIPWEVVLHGLIFFFSSQAVLRYSAPDTTERSGLLVDLWKRSCNNQSGIWPLPQQVLQQHFQTGTVGLTRFVWALGRTHDRRCWCAAALTMFCQDGLQGI